MSDEEKLNKHYESNPEKTLITLDDRGDDQRRK